MVNLPFEFVINSNFKSAKRMMTLAAVGATGRALIGKGYFDLNKFLKDGRTTMESSCDLML